jgi:hypothetical protein
MILFSTIRSFEELVKKADDNTSHPFMTPQSSSEDIKPVTGNRGEEVELVSEPTGQRTSSFRFFKCYEDFSKYATEYGDMSCKNSLSTIDTETNDSINEEELGTPGLGRYQELHKDKIPYSTIS